MRRPTARHPGNPINGFKILITNRTNISWSCRGECDRCQSEPSSSIPSVHGLNLRATADLWLSLIELLEERCSLWVLNIGGFSFAALPTEAVTFIDTDPEQASPPQVHPWGFRYSTSSSGGARDCARGTQSARNSS